MDTVVIVLLVLGVIAIILAAKGKPLWNNWAKPLWSWVKEKEPYLIGSMFLTIFLVGIDAAFGHVCTVSILIVAVFYGVFYWNEMRGPDQEDYNYNIHNLPT